MARTPRPAKTPYIPVQDRVVRIVEATPATTSTRILDDTMEHAWLVGCENPNCDHKMLVGKYNYRPVDFADDEGPMIKTIYTAPGRRHCGLHIPAPTRA